MDPWSRATPRSAPRLPRRRSPPPSRTDAGCARRSVPLPRRFARAVGSEVDVGDDGVVVGGPDAVDRAGAGQLAPVDVAATTTPRPGHHHVVEPAVGAHRPAGHEEVGVGPGVAPVLVAGGL